MENTLDYKYLKFIGFSQLSYWDVKRLTFNNSFSSAHKMVKLEKLLIPISEKIKKNEYDGTLKVVAKISFDEGRIYLREKSETGMDLYKIYAGDLLVSNINFHQGALAINNFGEDLVCSTHYQPYRINEDLVDKEFLIILLRSEKFKDYVVNQKSNGIKTESKYSFIKELEIPLPDSLEEQRKIIQSYKDDLKNALISKEKAENIEKEIEDYLVNELGIETSSVKNQKGKMYFVDFKNLDKWLLDEKAIYSKKYTLKTINQLSKISSGGTPSRTNKSYYVGNIPWIKTGELNHNIIYDTEEHINENAVKNSSAKLYKKGSILIAMYGATIGKTAKLGVDATTNQACAVLFDFVDGVNPDFIWKYFITQTNKLKSLAMGTAQPNINAGIVGDFKIPLPPIETQNQIVENIDKMKENSLKLKNEVDDLVKNSMVHFEKQIFNS